MDNAIAKALKTWYPKDHSLHNDLLHPAIGLAGEAGELLDLYKKERFKEGVSWWDCVYCGHSRNSHKYRESEFHHCNKPVKSPESDLFYDCHCKVHAPKILDELGDLWYYIRILAYQQKVDLSELALKKNRDDVLRTLFSMDKFCIKLLEICIEVEKINLSILTAIFFYLQDLLFSFDCTLDQLTELNWQKLKDGDNNGWAKAKSIS